VKEAQAGALISCGNTACLQFLSTLTLRKLDGVERPALAAVMPNNVGHFVMLDVGAEPNTSVRQMVVNALMGQAYARAVLDKPKPRIGLLTIGTEEGKGTERVQHTHEQLGQLSAHLNYVGPIEGFDVFEGAADVVVIDGFTGNVVLKSLQSCFKMLKAAMRESITASAPRKLGYLMAKGAFSDLKERFNPARYGGAPLLGLNGVVLKGHGSSDAEQVASAIRIADDTLSHELVPSLRRDIQSALHDLDAEGADTDAS
jgi:glycerol-3-phosphate acyltransferase PlsX